MDVDGREEADLNELEVEFESNISTEKEKMEIVKGRVKETRDREEQITMSALREWAASQGSKVLEAVAVNNLGKWKTATQMTALTILLATRDCSRGGPAILAGSGVFLLYIAAGLAIWSFVVYMRKIWKALLR